ncbi:MAG: hypothetical protein JXR37_04265 [Kiritimatiellae bacterium]|nr:hypothetical protein [Kiritimatiellia bacterium]
MKRRPVYTSLFAVVLLLACCGASSRRIRLSPAQEDVLEAQADFGADLYRTLAKGEGDLLCAPSALCHSLAVLQLGAGGRTQREIADVLHVARPEPEFYAALGTLETRFHDLCSDATLGLDAVSLRVAPEQPAAGGVQRSPELAPAAGAVNVRRDFAADPQKATMELNLAVRAMTSDQIQDMPGPGDVARDTSLLVLCAVCLAGPLESPFSIRSTRDAPFTMANGDKIPVAMMEQAGLFPYDRAKELDVLELPFRKAEYSLLILLPRQPLGMAMIEQQLGHRTIERWTRRLKDQTVQVFLPRFRLEGRYTLDRTLAAMGMPRAFEPKKADFSGIAEDREAGLFISKALHRTILDVKESEPAAGPGAGLLGTDAGTRAAKPDAVFRADHPFIVLVRDNTMQSLFLLGKVDAPAARRRGYAEE